MSTVAGRPAAPADPRLPGPLPAWPGAAWELACAAGFLALCVLLRRFVTDDAWITARYADTLAGGHGFAWNPAGPRVEGFSNPLLVAVEAAGRVVGAPPIDTARVVGVAAGVALILLVHRQAPAVAGRAATRAALPLIALSPALALWGVGGLETLPAALATTAGVLSLASPGRSRAVALRAGAAFAVLPWLRPEGIVVALAVVLCAELPGLFRRQGRAAAAVRLLAAAGPPLLSEAVLEGARLGIYGHLLPNSVIYKHAAVLRLEVAATFAAQAAPLILVAIAGALVARGRARLLAVAPLVYAAGSLQAVDSVDGFSRFFLPALPVLALLAGTAIAALARRAGPAHGVALVPATALLAAMGLFAGPGAASSAERFAGSYAACRQTARASAAAWLRSHTSRSLVFSISDAGLVPARAGGRTALDQFLLNEPLIQRTGPLPVHARVAWLYRHRPGAIVLTSSSPTRLRPRYPTDAAIAADKRFSRYSLADVARGGGAGCRYDLFVYTAEAEPAPFAAARASG